MIKDNKIMQEEEKHMRYEDAGIDSRILRAVGELGFEHMTPIHAHSGIRTCT